MENLVIDRGQWLTGTAGKTIGDGTLCHEGTHLMCCLGFYGETCGFNKARMVGGDTLTGKFGLGFVPSTAQWLAKRMDIVDSRRFRASEGVDVENVLASVNDRQQRIHPSRRESAIAYLFKKYGDIDVTFVGKYAEATKKAKDYIEAGQ